MDNWEFVGRDAMCEFYQENPKEALKNGYEVEDEKVKYLDKIADYQLPVILYAYPLDSELKRDGFIVGQCGGLHNSTGMDTHGLAYAVFTQPELSVFRKDW